MRVLYTPFGLVVYPRRQDHERFERMKQAGLIRRGIFLQNDPRPFMLPTHEHFDAYCDKHGEIHLSGETLSQYVEAGPPGTEWAATFLQP